MSTRARFPRDRAAVGLLVCAFLSMAPSTAAVGAEPLGGAVASADARATEAGLAMLRAGGNAADAAVATALALAVVHPQAGNLGGGGFAVVRFGGEVAALDFRETAPAAATPGMFLGKDGRPVPERSLVGPLAAGVPGSPAGLYELHRVYGRLPWPLVVAPAYRLAAGGFSVSERLHRDIVGEQKLLSRYRETSKVWLPDRKPPATGSTMRLPVLAGTLEAYAHRGPGAIIRGSGAEAIEEASRKRGGILTAKDVSGYAPAWREPVRFSAFGWEIAAMPLPSSGGILLGETLGIIERLGWSALPAASPDRAYLLVEAWRRAFADRFVLGDPATALAGPAQILDPTWLDRRAREISLGRASPSADVKPWDGAAPGEATQTTHLSVIDGNGDAVAMTVTLNGSFGCGLLVPDLGFLLNNEMDDFAASPGQPNLYGLVQGPANAVGPGKRMLSSMTPTIAWREGETLVLGSPGGSRIPTATAQVVLAVTVDGLPLLDAVEAPRIHHQWMPDEVEAEPGYPRVTLTVLEERGDKVTQTAKIGEVDAVMRSAGGRLEAAADLRGPGSAGVVSGAVTSASRPRPAPAPTTAPPAPPAQ